MTREKVQIIPGLPGRALNAPERAPLPAISSTNRWAGVDMDGAMADEVIFDKLGIPFTDHDSRRTLGGRKLPDIWSF